METFIELGGTLHILHDRETGIPIIKLTWSYYNVQYPQQTHENLSAAIHVAITEIKHQIVHCSHDPEVQQIPKGPIYIALLEWAKK